MIFKIRCAKLSANSRVDLSLIVNYHREEIGDIQAIKKKHTYKAKCCLLIGYLFFPTVTNGYSESHTKQ